MFNVATAQLSRARYGFAAMERPAVEGRRRYLFVDLIRGVAVVMMIAGHTVDALLVESARNSSAFHLYNVVRGMTAPTFLFISGFAFALAVRKSMSRGLAAALERLKRIALILAIGYGLHLPYFSLRKSIWESSPAELAAFFQADILQCVAVSLVMLLILFVAFREECEFASASGGLAAAIALMTPLVWEIDFGQLLPLPLATYFNKRYGSQFPLFPYAAFIFSGAASAAILLSARKLGSEAKAMLGLLIGGVALFVLGIAADAIPFQAYPKYDFWNTSPSFFAIRLGILLSVSCSLYFCESFLSVGSPTLFITLGRNSLFIYVSHLVLIYGSPANPGLAHVWGKMLSPAGTMAAALAMLASMIAIACAWDHLKSRRPTFFNTAKWATASVILLAFLYRKY